VPKQRVARSAPAGKKPRTRRERPVASAPARREEVLEAALELVAEHGVAGASLRMLAKRLGMSQPSLYHYFPSKDALVAEILDYSTQRMLGATLSVEPPKSLDEVVKYARDAVLELYATESHPRFVRFLFSVAVESKTHHALVERLFEQRLRPQFAALADALTKTSTESAYVQEVVKMVVYSLGFMLLDERALLGHATASAGTLRYSEWVLEAAERLLAERPR